MFILAAAAVAAIGLIGWGIFVETQSRKVITTDTRRNWLIAHVRFRAACHPAPIYGILETGLWLGVIVTLTDHLGNLQHGPTGWIVWALTIGPHEMGHFICMPFGWTLNVAGGTIWQLLIFLLPALYAMFRKRQITSSLLFWAMLGHSLINASVYIEDARERQLPLIFGMGPDHHDWSICPATTTSCVTTICWR